MVHFRTTFKFGVVIVLGFLVFLLDYWEITNPFFNELALLVISVSKSGYFIWFTLSNIQDTAHRDFYFHEFVPFLVMSVLLIILSFGVDYYCLFRINENAFSGELPQGHVLETATTFLYFSVTNFTTAGLGDIAPKTASARIFVMLELIIGFFFTILVIANITQIRESFSRKAKSPPDNSP